MVKYTTELDYILDRLEPVHIFNSNFEDILSECSKLPASYNIEKVYGSKTIVYSGRIYDVDSPEHLFSMIRTYTFDEQKIMYKNIKKHENNPRTFDLVDENGDTLLMAAIHKNYAQNIITKLLHIDYNHINKDGKTIFDMNIGLLSMISLLNKHIVIPDVIKSKMIWQYLYANYYRNHYSNPPQLQAIAETILNSSDDISYLEMKDSHGKSLLDMACIVDIDFTISIIKKNS